MEQCIRFFCKSFQEERPRFKATEYIGSELAKENGWSDSYLEDNLIAVRAEYYVAYDHQKTFLKDGDTEQYFFLLRDEKTQKWIIWNNTTSGDPYY